MPDFYTSGGFNFNIEFRYVDSDNIQAQTGGNGIMITTDAGSYLQVDTEDYSIKIIIEVII